MNNNTSKYFIDKHKLEEKLIKWFVELSITDKFIVYKSCDKNIAKSKLIKK